MNDARVDRIAIVIIIIIMIAGVVGTFLVLDSIGNRGRAYARNVANTSLETGRSSGDIITNGL